MSSLLVFYKIAGRRMNIYEFLKDCKGVIHIGSHRGNERKLYRNYDLYAVYVEAMPDVFKILNSNVAGRQKWVALNYLVTDKDDAEYDFKISSNRGLSSSIYDFKDHKKIWTRIGMVKSLKLKSVTLSTMLEREKLDVKNYDVLVMDTQGSEILVLRGAEKIVNNFKYIVTEVADFEAYVGCGTLKDIEAFMSVNNFAEHCRQLQVKKDGVGSYYDIVYKKK